MQNVHQSLSAPCRTLFAFIHASHVCQNVISCDFHGIPHNRIAAQTLPLLEPSSILLPPTTTDLIIRHQAQPTQETVWVHDNRFLYQRQLNAISNIHSGNRPLSPEEKRRKRNTTFPAKSERNKKDEIHLLLLNHPPPPHLLLLPPLSLPNPHIRNSPSSRNFCTSHPIPSPSPSPSLHPQKFHLS